MVSSVCQGSLVYFGLLVQLKSSKGRGAIRADFGPKSEINFVAI